MTLIIPHHKTKQQAVDLVNRGADDLFAGIGGGSVKILNFQKNWQGSTMSFSFTGSLGFVSVPLSGTVGIDDTNVVIECELPPMVKNFISDEKLSRSIEPGVKKLLSA